MPKTAALPKKENSDFEIINPLIKIPDNRAVSVNKNGILRINTKLLWDESQKSYHDVVIMKHIPSGRYLVTAKWRKGYMTDKEDGNLYKIYTDPKFKGKLMDDLIAIFDLNPDDFDLSNLKVYKPLKEYIYTNTVRNQMWDVPQYYIE